MNRLSNYIPWLLAAAFTLLMLTLSAGYSYHFKEFQLSGGPHDQSRSVELPYLEQGLGRHMYELKGTMHLSWFSPGKIQIIPDDNLEFLIVNGTNINLEHIPAEDRKNTHSGFSIDLSDSLRRGDNQVHFGIMDIGGDVGMRVEAAKTSWQFFLLAMGWMLLITGFCILGFRQKGVSRRVCLLYILILTGSVIQAAYIFTYNPVDHIWSDPGRHWEHGTDLLRTDLMALTDPVIYQVYVAVIAKTTLKIPELVAFYTLLLALFGPWIWYRFFRELQGNRTLALCGWAALSLLPSWTSIYAYFMQETLFIPMLGAALWSSWRCRRKSNTGSFLLMIFIWVLAGLTRGVAIPLAALVCTWLWLVQDLKLKKALYSILILLFTMGPLTYRSYEMVNHFAPHGMGHLNVIYAQSGKKAININAERQGGRWGYTFGSPSTGAKPFEPFSDWKTARTGTVRINIDLDEGKRDWDAELKKINMSFKDYLWITGENFIFLFFASSWPDSNLERLIDRVNHHMRFIWAPILLLILASLVISRKKYQGQWMLPSVLAAWIVVQLLIPISVNEGRYRKPFEGIAVAHLILWVAVIKGFTRSGPAAPPWGEYARHYLTTIRQKKWKEKTDEAEH